MKKTILTLFFVASVVSAQWVVQPYDTASHDNYWLSQLFQNGDSTAFMDHSNNTDDKTEGVGSIQWDYRIVSGATWGGYDVRVHRTDSMPGGKTYYDLSTGTELTFDYKVLTASNRSDTSKGVSFSIKLIEIDADGNRDLWTITTGADFETAGDWGNISLPLEVGDGSVGSGFRLQFGDGDKELQLDKIVGFEISLFYGAGTSEGIDAPTAEGTFLVDNMKVIGNRYTPLEAFESAAVDTVFNVDIMSWAGDGASNTTLTDNSEDFIEGAGALKWDYTVHASQSWGGYARIQNILGGPIEKFDERTAVVLYIKNETPITGTRDRVTMRFTLLETSNGTEEEGWTCEVPIQLSDASGWTRYHIPLVEAPTYNDSLFGGPGFDHFPHNGFSQPWWESKGDKVFNPEAVNKWHVTLSAGGNSYGDKGEKLSGTLLFDVFQQAGFQDADDTAPETPAGITAVASTFSNLITWADVDGEEKETYNVYFSDSPISDVNAEGIEVVQLGIEENVQVVEHVLLAPATDQDVTYYYAVNAVDKVGNIGVPGLTSAVTNTAKGVTTINPEAPVDFVADGDLKEWANITPFRMFPDDGSGTIVANKVIDGDADLSVNAWVAMDKDNVYIAFDVTDDIVSSDTTISSWLRDAADLHLGLFDWKGAPHPKYLDGDTPDYQFRFNSNQAIMASAGGKRMAVPSDANYFWGEKFTGGYTVEAKMSFADIADKGGDSLFVPVIGKRIPIDFGINDADATGSREGILTYSSRNGDKSWNDPSRWTHTWIGDEWVVGVDDNKVLVNTYELSQNYPNPFNPTTTINYSLAIPGNVSITVFNILGQQVVELVNQQQVAGTHKVNFDASLFSTGIYFYEINSGSFREVKKMMLIK